MALQYRAHGFVFKREDRLEADRVFAVFTREYGKVEVTGRAIRKIDAKLRQGIEIFSYCDIEFIQGKMVKTLTDAACIRRFPDLFISPEKTEIAHAVGEALHRFIRGQQADERIWQLLAETFEKLLAAPAAKRTLVWHYFLWNFISVLGHEPHLSACVSCAGKLNPYHIYFSCKEGGVLCRACAAAKKDGIKITSDVVKVLRLMLRKDWQMLLKLKLQERAQTACNKISHEYYRYLLSTYSI